MGRSSCPSPHTRSRCTSRVEPSPDAATVVRDLFPFLWGPVFDKIRTDPQEFATVSVELGLNEARHLDRCRASSCRGRVTRVWVLSRLVVTVVASRALATRWPVGLSVGQVFCRLGPAC